MLAVSFAAKAQSKLIFKDKFMYTDVQVFNETKRHSIPSYGAQNETYIED